MEKQQRNDHHIDDTETHEQFDKIFIFSEVTNRHLLVSSSPCTAGPVRPQLWPSDPNAPCQSEKKNQYNILIGGQLV